MARKVIDEPSEDVVASAKRDRAERKNPFARIALFLRQVMAELRMEAFALEADALVGVQLDFSEFSGGGKSMLFAVAVGTAVKVTKL